MQNSNVWKYTAGDLLPSFANDTDKAYYKVTFKDESDYYGNNIAESVQYVKEGDKPVMPDTISYIQAGDSAHWYIDGVLVDDNTVITNDCTAKLEFDITNSVASALVNNTGATVASKTTITKAVAKSGESVTASTNVVEGFTFKGWYSKN